MRTTLVGVLAVVVAMALAPSVAFARPVVDVSEFALPADAVGPFGIAGAALEYVVRRR